MTFRLRFPQGQITCWADRYDFGGVDWPTASVILHFCDARLYPIIDFRALWSLGIDQPPTYTNRFWQGYTAYVRNLSASAGHTMRTIDRALWQFSKERQRRTEQRNKS